MLAIRMCCWKIYGFFLYLAFAWSSKWQGYDTPIGQAFSSQGLPCTALNPDWIPLSILRHERSLVNLSCAAWLQLLRRVLNNLIFALSTESGDHDRRIGEWAPEIPFTINYGWTLKYFTNFFVLGRRREINCVYQTQVQWTMRVEELMTVMKIMSACYL